MKWFKQLSHSTPTSHSLIALFLAFVASFWYLYMYTPDFVMDKQAVKPQVSMRLVFVYSLLYASAFALLVFGYQYYRQSGSQEVKETSHASHKSHK